jgi:hypothetical protein
MSETTPEVGTSVLDDAELLRKATDAANGRKFSLLFEEGWQSTAVREAYGRPRDARLALVNHLLWWARHDVGQVWRLFEQSALCPDTLAAYREYFLDLVRAARSRLGEECYDPNYANGGETQ